MPALRTKKKLGKQALLRRAVTKVNRDFYGNELLQRPLEVEPTETAEPKLLYCAAQNISVLPSLETDANLVQAMQHALNSSETYLSRSHPKHKARQKRTSKAKSRVTSGRNVCPMMLHCTKDVSTSMSGVAHKQRKSGLSLTNSTTLKSQNSSRTKNSATGSYPSTWNMDDGREKHFEVVSSLAEVANCDCLNRTPYDHKLATPTTKRSKSMINCCQSIMRPAKAPSSKPRHKTKTHQQAAPIVPKAQAVPKNVTRHSTQTEENSWSQTPTMLEHKAMEKKRLERNQNHTNRANKIPPERPRTTAVSIGTSTPQLATPQTRILQVAKRHLVSKKKYSQKFTPSGVSVYSRGGQDIDAYETSYKSNVPCHINIQKLNRNSNIQLQCNNLKIICCNCDNSKECICLNDVRKGMITPMDKPKSNQSSKSSLKVAEEQRYADTEDYASDSGLDEGATNKTTSFENFEECTCPDVFNRESQHLGRIEKISQPPSVHARRYSARSARQVNSATFEDASSTDYEVSKVPQTSTDHVDQSGIFYMPHEKEFKKLMELDDDDYGCQACLNRKHKKVAPDYSDNETDNKSLRSNSSSRQKSAYGTPNSRKQRDQRSKGKNMNARFCDDKRCVLQCQKCSNQRQENKQEVSSSMQGVCPDDNCNRRCRRCMVAGASCKPENCTYACRRCTPKSQETQGKKDSYSSKHNTSATSRSQKSSGMLSREEASHEGRTSEGDMVYSEEGCYCIEVARQKPKDLSSSEDEFCKDVECNRRCKHCSAVAARKSKKPSRVVSADSLPSREKKYGESGKSSQRVSKKSSYTRAKEGESKKSSKVGSAEDLRNRDKNYGDSRKPSRRGSENDPYSAANKKESKKSSKGVSAEDLRSREKKYGESRKPSRRGSKQDPYSAANKKDSQKSSKVGSVKDLRSREKNYGDSRKPSRRGSEKDPYSAANKKESQKSSKVGSAEDLRSRKKNYGDSRKPSRRGSEQDPYSAAKKKDSQKSSKVGSAKDLRSREKNYGDSRKPSRRGSEQDPYSAAHKKDSQKSSKVGSSKDLRSREKNYGDSRKPSRRGSEKDPYSEANKKEPKKSSQGVSEEDFKGRVNKYEESRKTGRTYSDEDLYNAANKMESKKSSRVDSAENLNDKSRNRGRRDSEENLYRGAKKCPKSCPGVYRENISSTGAEKNLKPRSSLEDLENAKIESRKPTDDFIEDELQSEENEKDLKKSIRKSSKEQLFENCVRCCTKGLNSNDLNKGTEDNQNSNKVRPSSNESKKSKPSTSKSSVKKKGKNGNKSRADSGRSDTDANSSGFNKSPRPSPNKNKPAASSKKASVKKGKKGNKSKPDSGRSDTNANSSGFDKTPNPISTENKATEPYGSISVGFCSDDECDMTCPRCKMALAKSRQQDQNPSPHKFLCVPHCTKPCNSIVQYYGSQSFYAAPEIRNQQPRVKQFNSNSPLDRVLNSAYNASGNKLKMPPKVMPASHEKTYNSVTNPDEDRPNKRQDSQSFQRLHKDSGNKFHMNPADIQTEGKPGTTGRFGKSLLGVTLSKIKGTMHKCSKILLSRNRFHKDPSDIYALRSEKRNLYSSKSKSKDFEKRKVLDKSTPSTVMIKKQEYKGTPNWMCATESQFNKQEITYPTEPISKAKFGKYMPQSEEDLNSFNLKNHRTKTTSQNNVPGAKTKQSKPIPPIKPSNKPTKLKPIKNMEVDFAASSKRYNQPDDVKVLYDSSYKFIKSRDSECGFLSNQQRQKMPMVYECDSFLKSSDYGAWSKSRNKTKNHDKSSANNFFSIFSFKTKVPPKPKPKPQ